LSRPFANILSTIERQGGTIWLGQSVDTSTIHDTYEDFARLPILTSVGCAMRRPRAVSEKFDTDLRSRIGAKGSLMVDSGGFVLMTKQDSRWDVGRVGRLYDRIDADYLVSLDVPPNAGDSKADRLRKYDKTFRNLERLFRQFGRRVVPVVHGVNAEETESNCRRIKRLYPWPSIIGIGGLVPTLQKCGSVRMAGPHTPQKRIADSVRCVQAHFPHSRIHLFGVGSLHTVLGVIALGARSVDSIGWRQAAGFGSVYIPGRHRRLLTLRERERPCRPFASDDDLELLTQCRCPACRTVKQSTTRIARLAHHYKPRAVHNIWVLYSEIADYLRARQSGTATAFLSSRLSEAWTEAIGFYQQT
jgi:queuine/archaeosine tRNA-ribosyltransferase